MTEDFSHLAGTLAAGNQVAGYQIGDQIGTGGMAVVYRALDLRLDRQVALKVLAPRLAEDDGFRQRFIRESRAAAGVDHPHIIPVFEAGEADGVLFIAMRYVSGGDVRSLIQAEGTLSTARASAIASQAAAALDTAHAHGLVHRDVKPGNILLDSAGGRDHVYLADFGLSKYAVGANTLTGTGQFMGTLDYVSPEQIQGHRADGRADQYALACTVVEMLCGKPPYTQGREHGAAMGAAGGPAAAGDRNARRPPGRAQPGHRHRAVEVSGRPVPDLPGLRRRAGAGVRGAAGGVAGTDRARGRGADRGRHAASAPPRLGRPDQARAAAVGHPRGGGNGRCGPRQPASAAARASSRRGVRSAGPGPGSGRGQPGSEPVRRCRPDREPGAPGPASPRPRPADRPARSPSPRSPSPGSTAGRSGLARLGSGRRPAASRVGRPGRRSARAPGAVPPAGTWSPAREPHLLPQRQRPRRAGRRVLATILGVAVVAGLAFAGYKLLNRPGENQRQPAAGGRDQDGLAFAGRATALTPAGTVRAYFAAINATEIPAGLAAQHRRTQQRGLPAVQSRVYPARRTTMCRSSRQPATSSPRSCIATQRDGTVKTFQGTYTVTDGDHQRHLGAAGQLTSGHYILMRLLAGS